VRSQQSVPRLRLESKCSLSSSASEVTSERSDHLSASRLRARPGSTADRKPVAYEPPIDPMALPTSQLKRRAQIIKVASRMLERSAYHDIQVRDVGIRAGVALGTVYHYFASKERLFAAVLVDWSSSMSDSLLRDPLSADQPAERLQELMNRVLDAFERRPHIYRVIMVLEDSTDPHVLALLREHAATTRQAFVEPLNGLSKDDADAVVTVVGAVLGDALRSVVLGVLTKDEARRQVAQGINLVFSAPPRRRRRTQSVAT
jgi:AcrR family transcriptional regulator